MTKIIETLRLSVYFWLEILAGLFYISGKCTKAIGLGLLWLADIVYDYSERWDIH